MILEAGRNFSFAAKAQADQAHPRVREWEELMWNFQEPLPQATPGEKWLLMESFSSWNSELLVYGRCYPSAAESIRTACNCGASTCRASNAIR